LAGALVRGPQEVDVAEPGSPPLRISPLGFAQVSRLANAALVQAVLDAVGPEPGAVLEIYAGSGNFTRHLATRASRVWACDADADAVTRGRVNVPAAEWSARPPPADAFRPDLVLLDPPRTGADPPALDAAARAARRIVYVSCDPQTLARDVGRLGDVGFALTSAVAFDLMPHTYHVEIVAALDRT